MEERDIDVLEANHSYRYECLEMTENSGAQLTQKELDFNRRPVHAFIFTGRKQAMEFRQQIALQVGG